MSSVDRQTHGGALAIEVRDLRVSYPRGSFVLEIDALTLSPGERMACIGPSGTGKTTLVGVLSGLLAPERGSVRVLGADLARLSDADRRRFRLRRLGLVFQDLALVDYLSARDNIQLATYFDAGLRGGAARRDSRRRADELGGALGLGELLDQKPARLSQGERQRIAIARALFTDPALLVCDEPTGHLDPDTAAETLALFFAAVAERGASVFFVTHDHGLLERFDRVLDTRTLRSLHPSDKAAADERASNAREPRS